MTLTDMADGVEVGTIREWHKSESKIPPGWIICDGNNGTPDLVGRYAKGVNGTSSGNTGGSNSHTHTFSRNIDSAAAGTDIPALTTGNVGSQTEEPAYTGIIYIMKK